ncbi:hypothetical protein HYV82_00810 [Candidatus Woesearchaeota archaeon]|nr:hypothetical protein [Candidatus Woesearchaeota archaeon]
MSPEDLVQYIGWAPIAVMVGSCVYVTVMLGLTKVACGLSKKIESQSDLESIAHSEALRLGLEEPVRAVLDSVAPNSYADIAEGGAAEIHIRPDVATHAIVRHELYHLYGGHITLLRELGARWGGLLAGPYYWIISEPSASIYAVLGIRLGRHTQKTA